MEENVIYNSIASGASVKLHCKSIMTRCTTTVYPIVTYDGKENCYYASITKHIYDIINDLTYKKRLKIKQVTLVISPSSNFLKIIYQGKRSVEKIVDIDNSYLKVEAFFAEE